MNGIWVFIITTSVCFSFLYNRLDGFTKALFEASKTAVEVSIFLLGIIALWLGITKIIEDSGLINKLSRLFKPFVKLLFKNIPDNHPAITSITLNLLANAFGIGNAATPLGIKAMKDLQSLNTNNDSLSFDMMLFIVVNTASIQLIPFTVIGILAGYGSIAPNSILIPVFISTVLSAAAALIILHTFRRIYK